MNQSEYKCPFSIIQASGLCRCQFADEVIRRGGSEFNCKKPDAHEVCTSLTQHLNTIALPALGFEDDLTLTPKSVYERILIGGLQGLRMAENPDDTNPETADIWVVVENAQVRYLSMENIPNSDFIPAIEACRIKKRRRKTK